MAFSRLFGRVKQPYETSSRVTVRNETLSPLLAIYEPWCYTFYLAPDEECVFDATSPRAGWLTVEYGPDAVTVHAWDACVGRMLRVDGTVIDTFDIRVPDFTALDEESRRHDRDQAV